MGRPSTRAEATPIRGAGQKCDSFLKQAETYLKKREKQEAFPRRHQQQSFWANLCGVPP